MKKTIILMMLVSAGAFLSGCGRKGPTELPPSAMIEDGKGGMVSKPKEDKPFILDPLIR